MSNNPSRANKFALFLILFSTFISFFLSFAISKSGIDPKKALLALIVLQDLIIILIPVLIYLFLTRTKLTDLVPHEKLTGKNVIYIIILTILISPIITLVSSVTTLFYPADVNTEILYYIDSLSFPLAMIALAVMPAVFEELAFRGVILSNYKSTGLLISALISGLFFGLFHQDFYQIGYAIVAGVFFSFIVAYTNSIYASMLSHFLINGTQVAYTKLILSLIDDSMLQEIMNQAEQTGNNYGTIVSGIFFTVIFTPLLIVTAKKFMEYNKGRKLDYELSITENETSEFEIDINTRPESKKKGFIDIYFILYVIVSVLLTILYSAV